MKNKIEDLRDHLFATLEDLRDPDSKVDLDRVKVEVTFIEVTGSCYTSVFIPDRPRQNTLNAPKGASPQK